MPKNKKEDLEEEEDFDESEGESDEESGFGDEDFQLDYFLFLIKFF